MTSKIHCEFNRPSVQANSAQTANIQLVTKNVNTFDRFSRKLMFWHSGFSKAYPQVCLVTQFDPTVCQYFIQNLPFYSFYFIASIKKIFHETIGEVQNAFFS